MALVFLKRDQINVPEWDRCVAGAHNALLYGHSWYLDAVTNVPDGPRWRWEGLVATDNEGGYTAVLPVPLRRRWGHWVVYQPLFCQFLAIFSAQPVDPAPFLEVLLKRYRYASRLCLALTNPLSNVPGYVQQRLLQTHVLTLDSAAPPYTRDRRMNLRRAHRRAAQTPGWQVVESSDVQPLLTLFRSNHADEIGVGEWAYPLFTQLVTALQARGLGTLRYACVANVPVAGAFFAEGHRRVIYLFNAANADGRRLNARTLLLDEAIQHATSRLGQTGLFDFESPEKPGVVQFYESFGAIPVPYLQLSWNRLTAIEKWIRRIVRRYQTL
ncbi:GNAT family N-acetyltransferase [Fibrella sp. WM1]|uniref:GNAT family N-acetyltransferase n=1 Tax=Fibrella musci TaxID=3242485 RepID=UPI003522D0AE